MNSAQLLKLISTNNFEALKGSQLKSQLNISKDLVNEFIENALADIENIHKVEVLFIEAGQVHINIQTSFTPFKNRIIIFEPAEDLGFPNPVLNLKVVKGINWIERVALPCALPEGISFQKKTMHVDLKTFILKGSPIDQSILQSMLYKITKGELFAHKNCFQLNVEVSI